MDAVAVSHGSADLAICNLTLGLGEFCANERTPARGEMVGRERGGRAEARPPRCSEIRRGHRHSSAEDGCPGIKWLFFIDFLASFRKFALFAILDGN